MEQNSKNLKKLIIWAILLSVFLIHLFLAKKWSEEQLCFFRNTHAVFEGVSMAYQKAVNSHCGLPCFSIFQGLKTNFGQYWPPLTALIDLWILLVVPLQWFFLPNFLYLAAIMLGIFFSSKYLCGDDFYSMLAAVIFSCYWF